jgi:hypothetical protein
VAGITLHFDKLDGSQNIELPLLPIGSKISIIGSSTPGGPVDLFTGTPSTGALTHADNFVPLFTTGGQLASISLAKKTSAGIYVPSGTVPLVPNSLGDVKLIPGKVATFVDADGDFYTVKLTGPGIIGYKLIDFDMDGQGSLARLALEGTTFGASVLTITVVQKAPNGDGRVEIGEITGTPGAGLKSISAPKADLVGGGMVFSGAIGSVTLGDLENGADLIAGALEGAKTTVRLHEVGDGSEISFGTAITLLQAARIGDAAITVPSLAKLTVTGDRLGGLVADLGAQIKVAGLLGSLTAGDVTATAIVEAGGSPLERTVLAMRSVADGVNFSLASAVTSLRATAIGDATFSAYSFNTVVLTGSLAGDFTAIGKIGRIVGRDVLGSASIVAGGLASEKTALVFQAIHNAASIVLESSISLLRATQIGDVSITAAALGTLLVTGNVPAGLAGDFLGTLTLEGGDDVFKNALGTARIAGGVYGASIQAESIGVFTAARIKDSTIFAGFTPADPGNPMAGGVFFEGGSIRSFVIRSGTAAFDNTVVAAKTIGAIRVVSVDFDNGGTPFGFLTNTVPARVSVSSFVYDKAGAADQFVGDFHVQVV